MRGLDQSHRPPIESAPVSLLDDGLDALI
jgi:hypothetical protein